MTKIAFVAGASSGLGAEMARALAEAGYMTYAGARSFAGETKAPEGCISVPLDVTNQASVDAAIERILSEAGRIDALIVCAAQIILGACEEVSPGELLSVMETNFIGAVRLVQAALPSMRAQGRGHIVLFSSLNGLFAIPFTGAYIASKHAIEGFGEALWQEVRRFGIGVTLVEPGDCQSGSETYRQKASLALSKASPYQAAFASATNIIRRDELRGMPPARVSKAVLRALRKKKPPVRVIIAPLSQKVGVWLHDLLPARLFHRLIESAYRGKHS